MDIKVIIKYCEQHHAPKFDNSDEIDQFLERYKLAEHIRRKRKTSIVPYLLKKLYQIPDPDGFTDKFYKHLRKK